MLKYITIFMAIGLLSACQNIYDGTRGAGRGIGENYVKTSNRIGEWFKVDDRRDDAPYPQNPRYCYRTASDVLCYNQPLQGQEERLVGWQGGIGMVAEETVTPAETYYYDQSAPTEPVTVQLPPPVESMPLQPIEPVPSAAASAPQRTM
jgi:hypothetical protein